MSAEDPDERADQADAEEERDLTDIGGVGTARAEELRSAGFETVEDLAAADEDDIADVVGNALAARIKADVGGLEVTEETEAEVEIEEEEKEAEPESDEDVETERRPRIDVDIEPDLDEETERLLGERERVGTRFFLW